MLNMSEIDNTIEELKNQDTSFAQCSKLADLYIVKYFNKPDEDDQVINEYSDILPAYSTYCNTKRDFQLKKTTNEAVLQSAKQLNTEIYEFLLILYSSSDMHEERSGLKECLMNVLSKMEV